MNHSLAAVASRIQERNNALTTELATLDDLRSRLVHAESELASNASESANVRAGLLNAVVARHGTELERLRVDDDVARLDCAISNLRTEMVRVRDRAREVATTFEEDVAPAYSDHVVSTSLYSTRCERALERARQNRRVREGRLRNLRERTEGQRREADGMRLERDRMDIGFAELDRREEEDDEETMALGMQIKSALAKVGVFFFDMTVGIASSPPPGVVYT